MDEREMALMVEISYNRCRVWGDKGVKGRRRRRDSGENRRWCELGT